MSTRFVMPFRRSEVVAALFLLALALAGALFFVFGGDPSEDNAEGAKDVAVEEALEFPADSAPVAAMGEMVRIGTNPRADSEVLAIEGDFGWDGVVLCRIEGYEVFKNPEEALAANPFLRQAGDSGWDGSVAVCRFVFKNESAIGYDEERPDRLNLGAFLVASGEGRAQDGTVGDRLPILSDAIPDDASEFGFLEFDLPREKEKQVSVGYAVSDGVLAGRQALVIGIGYDASQLAGEISLATKDGA